MKEKARTQPIILASASPARQELLRRAGISCTVVPAHVRELRGRGRTLRQTVIENASRKAAWVARRHPNRWVLAADTMLEYQERLYGKPSTRAAAVDFLARSAGDTHILATGVVLQKGRRCIRRCAVSRITLKPLTRTQISGALRRMDPTRFAGGYSIRVRDPLITRVDGSITNVIGLPMEIVMAWIRSRGG